jgi:Family of unknown function (DUF6348)
MRRHVMLIALTVVIGCGKDSSRPSGIAAKGQKARSARRADMDNFFAEWLKAHGHKDVVVDADGVGIEHNATRLQAGLYGSKQHDKGGFVVEVEFTVHLPSGQEITEFVAGTAETEDKAIKDALLNFTLTTFHVLYKGFINAADPHMTQTKVTINGVQRDLISGDIFMRGNVSDKDVDLQAMRRQIRDALTKFSLTPGPHWIKVIYSQLDKKPMTVAVTLDNGDQADMTDAIKRLDWPHLDGFYMAKQFIVVK